MKRHAVVATGIVALLVFGSASAGDVSARSEAEETPHRDQDRPDISPRCTQIGSDIYECEADISCWEDEGKQMSVCIKGTYDRP